MKTYYISDCRVLLDDLPLFTAKNSRDAVMQYLKFKGENSIIKLDKKGNISAVPVQEMNGLKIKKGRYAWYKILPNKKTQQQCEEMFHKCQPSVECPCMCECHR